MKHHFFTVRGNMNAQSDSIHLTVKGFGHEGIKVEDVYKAILKLDGQFRAITNGWTLPPLKVQVISQL